MDFHLRFLESSPLLSAAGLLIAAWLAWFVFGRVIVRILARLAQASPLHWDDAMVARKVPQRMAWIVPALVVLAGMDYVEGLPELVRVVVRNVSLAWIAIAATMVLGGALDAVNDIYVQSSPFAQDRPIKGYLQLLKIIFWVVALILVVAALVNRSPLVLLTGLGAMTAVLMLVFKDTLLSLVASVQLASNDMLRVGDWIEMPSQNTDGDVIDISLHTVKVQNWDKTISTVPTHLLISESFRNWRGMTDSGGRRIKRSLLLDQTSVRFLDHEERQQLRRIALIDEYLDKQREELAEYNAKLEAAGKDPVNNRRATNLGTFRAYVMAYLRSHPGVNQDMTLLVRQQDPTEHGIPLQIYCFSADVRWAPYENLAGDIFDHLLAVLPEFGLRVYQQPGSGDIEDAVAGVTRAISTEA
jgi:miniconductance mechanosensitive channel